MGVEQGRDRISMPPMVWYGYFLKSLNSSLALHFKSLIAFLEPTPPGYFQGPSVGGGYQYFVEMYSVLSCATVSLPYYTHRSVVEN